MKRFLQEIAQYVNQNKIDEFDQLDIIFPNRRAGLFFRQQLASLIDRPIWSPRILSIEDFVKGHSQLQSADKLSLIVLLYQVYHRYLPQQQSLDAFYYWGDMMLKDFDDIDKSLASAESIFSNLYSQKEIESRFDYIEEAQKQLIRDFWGVFAEKLTKEQQVFLQLWEKLFPIYEHYKKLLWEKQIGYDGMLYRDIADNIDKLSFDRQYIFAGFNAFTKAEKKIVNHLLAEGKAQLFWDIDAYYVDDEVKEAGYFFRQYQKEKQLSKTFPVLSPKQIAQNRDRAIHIYGLASEVAQLKKVAQSVEQLLQKNVAPESIALVLTDESLLLPLLNSLPTNVERVNVTMGYPIKNAPVYDFLLQLLRLQISARDEVESNYTFNYRELLSVLKNPYFARYNTPWAAEIANEIVQQNKIRIAASELSFEDASEYPGIFQRVSTFKEAYDYLLAVISFLYQKCEEDSLSFEQEVIHQIYCQLNRLNELALDAELQLDLNSFHKLFKQVMQMARVPFTGEPLKGLQVMGVLETRNLDFDYVFILSMNEGNFPASPQMHSFVPYNLRKAFGLTTFEQQDAIYAYYFYRLLQRTRQLHLFYNTADKNGMPNEMSRYIYQVLYDDQLRHQRHFLGNKVGQIAVKPIVIPKDERVQAVLQKFISSENGVKERLSPSAVNSYIECSLKFYFRYIVKLYEKQDIEEDVNAVMFGNLLHNAIEMLFRAQIEANNNNQINIKDLEALQGKIDEALIIAFKQHFGYTNEQQFKLSGQNLIAFEMLKRFISKILQKDKEYSPFEIIGLETKASDGFYYDIPVSINGEKKRVGLKGIIDRIDKKDNKIRIIDYKTGKDNKKVASVESLFDSEDPFRNKAGFQTFYYSLLYYYGQNKADKDDSESLLMPGLYNSSELFRPGFSMQLQIKDPTNKRWENIEDIRPYLPIYHQLMQQKLANIFDTSQSFQQTDDINKCKICPYVEICHRG